MDPASTGTLVGAKPPGGVIGRRTQIAYISRVPEFFTMNQDSLQTVGLKGWWPGAGSKGGLKAVDYGPLRNHGAATGNANYVIDAEFGRVMTLDGSGDYWNFGALSNLGLSGDQAFTLMCWAKPAAMTHNACIISYGAAATNRVISISTYALGYNRIYSVHYGNDHSFPPNNSWTINAWQHVAVTYDPVTSTERCYKNGAQIDSWNPANIALQAGDNLYVGRAVWTTADFSCRIADVRLYNVYKSAAEVYKMWHPRTRFDLYKPI